MVRQRRIGARSAPKSKVRARLASEGRRQAEQRLTIRAPLSLLQTALVRQERRALHKEQGKRRHVRHRVAHITSLPQVRQRLTAPAQRPNETIQDFHAPEKPDFRRRGKPSKAFQSLFPPDERDPQALSRLSVSLT